MSIATSLDKLSETLTNCKTNLKEKGVEADSIKISDVDEKIMEIQAGGGGGSSDYSEFYKDTIEKVEVAAGNDEFKEVKFGEELSLSGSGNIKVKVSCKNEMSWGLKLYYRDKYYHTNSNNNLTPIISDIQNDEVGNTYSLFIETRSYYGGEPYNMFYCRLTEPYNAG